MSARRLPPRLLALSPGKLRERGDCEAFARAAMAGFEAGLRGLLLREPGLTDREASRLAEQLVGMAREHEGSWVGVHDRAHIALAVGADGVHLGFRSLTPASVAALVDGRLAVGYSAHAGEELAACVGADYLFLGPVLDTASKRGLVEPLGFEALQSEIARLDRPTWAIGGLSPEHVTGALAARAAGIAVLSGIFGQLSGIVGQADPAQRVRDHLAALG